MYNLEELKQALLAKYASTAFEAERHEKRYLHSLSVALKAQELVRRFSLPVDENEAMAAGVLHDYAKFVEIPEYQARLEEAGESADVLKAPFKVLHSLLGPLVIRHDLGIADEELLAAIRTHTLGSASMDTLAEVIYLADFIEDRRVKGSDPSTDVFAITRGIARTSFKRAIAYKTECNMMKLLNHHQPIGDETLATYRAYRQYLEEHDE